MTRPKLDIRPIELSESDIEFIKLMKWMDEELHRPQPIPAEYFKETRSFNEAAARESIRRYNAKR